MAVLTVRDKNGKEIEIPAIKGKSAYSYARDGGYTGTEAEFTQSMGSAVGRDDFNQLLENNKNYVTKTELEAKKYLTSVPDEYVTETELNSKGYLTSVPDEYVTETELNSKGYLTQHQDLSSYAKKATTLEGYGIADGATKSQLLQVHQLASSNEDKIRALDDNIPTKTSQLTNDSKFLTSVPDEYVTETELTNKGYALKSNAETWTFTLDDGTTVTKKVVLA